MASPLPRPLRRIAVAALSLAVAGTEPLAAAAAPAPIPTPSGFTTRGHANISVVTPSHPINGSIQIAAEQRGNLGRVDVLSVQSDAMPLPPIRFTVIVDRNVNKLTIWNDVTKKYYTQAFVMKAGGIAVASPSRTGRPTSPFAALDIFTFTMKLTGHSMTNGVATTGLAADVVVARKGDTATTHVTMGAQLVDDAAFFPMTFDMTVEPANVPAKANFSYAVDSFTRRTPPLSHFVVPAGYAKAKNLLDAMQPSSGHVTVVRPMPMMSPTPMVSPMALPSGTPMTSPLPMTSPMPMSSGVPMTSPLPMASGMPMTSPMPMMSATPHS